MSVKTIREKLNRPELDYIWNLIDEGDFCPYALGQKLRRTDDSTMLDVISVLRALQQSNEYEAKYFIEGLPELYDSPLDIPCGVLDVGEIGVILRKKLDD